MARRIHLVRHGVSSHVHDGSWIDAAAARRFIELYDAAGIRDEPPPPEVVRLAGDAELLAASTLPRAMESIERLAPGRAAETTPLLREIDFQTVGWMPISLPVNVWDTMDYLWNGYRIRRRHPTPEMLRAHEATEWLLSRLTKDSTLLAVTHGGFRRFLWAALVDRGWAPEFTRKRYHNWSVWTFRAR